MNLSTFKALLDGAPSGIETCQGDLERLYAYVGLQPHGGSFRLADVGEALYAHIRAAFTGGHAEARRICQTLTTDLIREHVILDASLDPYFDVINHLRDALNTAPHDRGPVKGDWAAAIKAARDHATINPFGYSDRARIYPREFNVARAARALKDAGYVIRLAPEWISLEDDDELRLIKAIEDLVANIGGLNVARRIFSAITPLYDEALGRYLMSPNPSMIGGGQAQVPWGYLLQLAVKHIDGRKPYMVDDNVWRHLLGLATAYAAVVDVQPYTHFGFVPPAPQDLLRRGQEMALYDTLFRFPQLRSSDASRLTAGLLSFLDPDIALVDGWTPRQACEIVSFLFEKTPDVRGPIFIDERVVRNAMPHIPGPIISQILDAVLSHPPEGANRSFSRPTDAPTVHNEKLGLDFLFRPLLHHKGRRFLMIDRSMCAAACPEALMSALRNHIKQFDDKVGLAAEAFLAAELLTHGVPSATGKYNVPGAQGECDLVVETPGTVVFLELKKKALTRRARAGTDVDLLLDLAGSLVKAQAQAGWHEVRLRRHGRLALTRNGVVHNLERGDREVERIAVALLDYGGFQDRIFLAQLLEATLAVNFSPSDPSFAENFNKLNSIIVGIRKQLVELHPGKSQVAQPFFHCWFLSLPQILAILDTVTDVQSFQAALWETRHVTTGASDFYVELAYMRRLKSTSTNPESP